MQLTTWDPFREIEDMFDRYARLPARWSGPDKGFLSTGDWAPRVDIAESEKAFTIKAEIPEIKKEDVSITLEGGTLTIQGERKQEKEEKDKKYHRVERCYGRFSRSFSLPDNVDETKIEAAFKEGMLTLILPKTGPAKPRAIEVKIR